MGFLIKTVPGVVGVTLWLTGRIRGNAILCLPSLSGIWDNIRWSDSQHGI